MFRLTQLLKVYLSRGAMVHTHGLREAIMREHTGQEAAAVGIKLVTG